MATLASAITLGASMVFCALAQDVPQLKFTVTDFVVTGDNPLGDRRTREVLAPYLGEHVGLERLQAAAKALQQALVSRGYAFHRVIIPPQRATGGTFRLQALTFSLSHIEVRGNSHFSTGNVTRSLTGLSPGKAPDVARLGRSLAIANAHPSKRVSVTLRESPEPDALDALVTVVDQDPMRVFAGANTRGSSGTGRWRTTLGFQHSNLFDRDHTVTLSYTTSPGHAGDVKQIGTFYRWPLYSLGASADVFYARSDIDSGTVAEIFEVSGRGEFLGARLVWALRDRGTYSHNVSVAVDDKLFEDDVRFAGAPLGTDVRSRPLTARYDGTWKADRGTIAWYAAYSRNLGGGNANTPAAYAATRAGADDDWSLVRYGASLDRALGGGWRVIGRIDGQQANEPLIPGEQFGIGGVDTVRGFEEREITGDSAQQVTVELWSPRIEPGLRFLAFLDAGRRRLNDPLPGEKATERALSTGIGVRLDRREHLAASFDIARVLDGGPRSRSGSLGAHFDVVVRY